MILSRFFRSRTVRRLAILILVVWEFPQTFVGLCVMILLRITRRGAANMSRFRGRILCDAPFGVSLGFFLFVPPPEFFRSRKDHERVCCHEWGHTRQSILTGPFYLFVIGIPSFLRAGYAYLYAWKTGRMWTRYYDGYPEAWADRLGNSGG